MSDQALPDLADFAPYVPVDFRDELTGRPAEPHIDGDSWLARLPHVVREISHEWQLTPAGPVRAGSCAIVVPVTRAGEAAALKVMWPHTESDTEHLALRAWNGHGAVRLLAADPGRGALLLERLHADHDLSQVDLLEACEVIGELMVQLDRPALPQLRVVDSEAEQWSTRLAAGSDAVPRRLTTQAASYLRELVSDLTERAQHDPAARRLVHEDLHFANVLAADRAPWLAIDPKPVAAPWEFAVAPALWNRAEETRRAHNPRAHLRLRLGVICEAAGLDEDAAMHWSFVRVVLNALSAAEYVPDSRDFISRMLVVAKAMTD